MARNEIARYAAEVAGTREDLDEDLEAASLELWRLESDEERAHPC